MAHLRPEELLAKLQQAREAGKRNPRDPAPLRLYRELVEECPAFTPNLLQLARALRLVEEPGANVEAVLTEVQHLLEHAVQASHRSADALIELAYFLDIHRGAPDEARRLLEEGAAKALGSLEDAWAGLITLLIQEDDLAQALELGERAKKVFPDSLRIISVVYDARQAAITAGLLPPEPGGS